MAHTHKQLAQSRPGVTSAASIYSPGASTETTIKAIVICNTTASSAAFSIYIDDNGTTYDQTTALFYSSSIGANETVFVDTFLCMNDSTGNFAVQTDTASALTFTVFGAEIT